MQNRICKYLRHPTEAFRLPAGASIEDMRRSDELDIDLCNWLLETSGNNLPPPLQRRAGGIDLNNGDCDKCPLFEPVVAPAWQR